MSYVYAGDTSVSVEKSRAEIETVLNRYGASRFGSMTEHDHVVIVFEMTGRAVKFVLPIPSKDAFKTKLRRGYKVAVSPEEQHKNWEQACRSRWRSLALSIKAKLECVTAGITSFEIEFLAHFVTDNGKTIGDRVVPQLQKMKPGERFTFLQLGDAKHTDI